MYFCHQCGTQIEEYAVFCSNCGAPKQKDAVSPPEYHAAVPQDGYGIPQAEDKRAAAGSALSTISAVIYPLILSGVLLFLFNTGETSVAGLIIGLLFAAGTGVAMGMGGFYLIIIPLPIVFLFKWGCSKPAQKFSRKLTLGLLSFICPALVFASAFLLR